MDWWHDPDPLVLIQRSAAHLANEGMDPFDAAMVAARFWKKVDRVLEPDMCWLWTSAADTSGRAQFSLLGRSVVAPRLVLKWTRPNDDPTMFACHTCDEPMCVLPDHLWWGTRQENVQDMIARGRDRNRATRNRIAATCPLGHPLDGINNRGQRFCKECARRRRREYYRRNKELELARAARHRRSQLRLVN